MELTLISDVQLGSVIEIEYTICDDGGGPISSNPLTFNIWWEAKIVLNSKKN